MVILSQVFANFTMNLDKYHSDQFLIETNFQEHGRIVEIIGI